MLFVIAAIGLLALAWLAPPGAALSAYWRIDAASLLMAGGLYLLSHLMRVLRLGLLLAKHEEFSLMRLGQAHLFTAGLSLLLPFKLGEGMRIVELGHLTGGLWRGFALVWLERVFDALMLLPLLLLALGGDANTDATTPLILSLTLFAVATLLAFVVLPQNLTYLIHRLIRRHHSQRALLALDLMHRIRSRLLHVTDMARGKLATLVTLSFVIWFCEIGLFWLLLHAMADSPEGLFAHIMTALSDSLSAAAPTASANSATAGYAELTRLILTVCAIGALIPYAAWRLRSKPRLRLEPPQ
ncbi:hypothetical protein MAIT1_03013 [Magnetofaba australis IT-1]|uniref:Uncharacterized protein n=1 Tax=Magnetofaba australis IT-1 TaxID=1434232 RepID=A0A1Y2K7Z7_9PROT|nr:hypothetical protein MAIT1_03013 [Magnetofaba australis IT-1]